MDAVLVERDLTTWVAESLGLDVDENVFRGGIPDGSGSGMVGVMLGQEDKENSAHMPRYSAQVLGKFDDRDDAWRALNLLSSAVPCYGDTTGSTIFVSITSVGRFNDPYKADDGGRKRHFFSVNLLVAVLEA